MYIPTDSRIEKLRNARAWAVCKLEAAQAANDASAEAEHRKEMADIDAQIAKIMRESESR